MRSPFMIPLRVALVSLTLLAGCGEATGPAVPAGVEILDAPAELIVGRRAPLRVEVKDESGRPIPSAEVRWYSSNPFAATISLEGEVTAIGPGSTTITAQVGPATGGAQLTVVPVPISSIAIDVAGGNVAVGGLRGAAVYAFDIDGTLVVDRQVDWTISDTTIATVRATGFATAEVVGRRGGLTTLTATLGGKSASARITVNGG